MKTTENATVLGRSTTFRGELVTSEEILIEGTVEGIVLAKGARVTIGEGAKVHADVTAQEIIVFGRVEGNLRATERVDLRSSGVVIGDVFAKRISMEEEAMLRGRVDPNRAGEPAPVAAASKPAPMAPILMQAGTVPAAPTLFSGTAIPVTRPEGREFGSMPSGLAAAARSLESPAASNALVSEGDLGSHDELSKEPI